jgi:NhaP-type Na+/H+ or K+/H+ antiporter
LLVLHAGLEIVLTLGAAYGCHFVTEDLLGASGLLAVVVMGFSMSVLGEHARHAALLSMPSPQWKAFCACCTCGRMEGSRAV